MMRLVAASALVASVLVWPAAAQQSTMFDTVDVTVVNVDVVVTDRQGNPVRGLTREDFIVLDQGKPVELTNFSAIESGRLLLDPDIPQDPLTAPGPAAEQEQAPRLDLMILVDNTSIQPQNRKRLIEEVERALDQILKPGDRAMVAANNGEVELMVGLTDDRQALRQALEAAGRRNSRAIGATTEFARVIRDLEQAGDSGPVVFESECRAVLSDIRAYASARYSDAVRSAGALREWVNSLAALPGRKAVLLLSDGFSNDPADAVLEAWERKCSDVLLSAPSDAASFREFDTGRIFLDLGDHANANRVTFYSIGGESRTVSASSPDTRGLDITGARVWNTSLQVREETNLRASLSALSTQTGGLSGVGVSGLRDLFATMRRDFDDYYSMAYTLESSGAGSNRDIEVRFASSRPGLQLRFREGYRDKTQDERLQDQAISVALLGEGSNPLGLEMRTGPLTPAEKGLVDVPVVVRFPLSAVVLLPGEEALEGRLMMVVTARDERGQLSEPQRIAIPVRVPKDMADQLAGQYAGYSTVLRLRRGPHRIGVVVRDLLGAVDSATFFDHDPG
jgi:VWFA-related protein